MGYDSLCALTQFNTRKLKKNLIDEDINNCGIMYAVAMNAEETVTIGKFKHQNETIERDINEILKIKLNVP